jgi:predicted ester cyclase
MSLEENKTIAYRYFEEAYNQKNINVLDEIVDENVKSHSPQEMRGIKVIKEYVAENRKTFPDVKFFVEDQIAEGDKVVTRITFKATHKGKFRGIAPTGKKVTVTGINIMKIINGKIVESWAEWDAFGLMQQLGVITQK